MKAFPRVDAQVRDWCNLVESDGTLRTDELARLIDSYIPGHDLLIWVSRKIGDFLPKDEAIRFIAEHIGEGEIRIADRQFSGFVVVAMPGVGTGWQPLPPELDKNQ